MIIEWAVFSSLGVRLRRLHLEASLILLIGLLRSSSWCVAGIIRVRNPLIIVCLVVSHWATRVICVCEERHVFLQTATTYLLGSHRTRLLSSFVSSAHVRTVQYWIICHVNVALICVLTTASSLTYGRSFIVFAACSYLWRCDVSMGLVQRDINVWLAVALFHDLVRLSVVDELLERGALVNRYSLIGFALWLLRQLNIILF